MSDDQQQQLVSVLYSVHDKLRVMKSQAKDEQEWDNCWKEHTSDFKTLKEYSKAMYELGTQIWEPRNAKSADVEETSNTDASSSKDQNARSCEKLKCRLEWVVHCCRDYFKDRFGADGDRLKLLDVGSCYNPFSKYSNVFDIVAVDLCPAPGFENQIFKCDFLEVKLDEIDEVEGHVGCSKTGIEHCLSSSNEIENCRRLTSLPKNCFEVVVFSYFLEYLADAKQRELSCRKAFELLREGGILFVLRPDSSRVTPGGNNVLIKKMKVGMALLGFKRIYFQKLEHLWCMGFMKMTKDGMSKLVQGPYFKKDVRIVGAEFAVQDSSRVHELFSISQDFKHHREDGMLSGKTGNHSTASLKCDEALFQELPNFEVSPGGKLVKRTGNETL